MTRTGRAVVYSEPNAPFEAGEYPVRDVLPRITMPTIYHT